MNKKLTYIVSEINKMIALEWICNHFKKNKTQIEVSFVFINSFESEIETYAKKNSFNFIRLNCDKNINIFNCIIKTWFFLIKNKTEIIHCHLFKANLIGLISAKLAFVPVRIYTRHHSTYHHEYYPNIVKYDRICNYLSTKIVSISNNVSEILIDLERVPINKIVSIPHGFQIDYFSNINIKNKEQFRIKYKLNPNDIIIGVVSRYTKWKGVQYIIPAFLKVLKKFPNAKLLLANALGNDKQFIDKLLEEIPSNNLIQIKYENNMAALYHNIDVYIHTPINEHCEAFGQTYVEALLSSIPSVFTLSGIAKEFIVNKKNAYVVNFCSSVEIYEAIINILENKSQNLEMIKNGFEDASNRFNLEKMITRLNKIYLGE